MFSRNLLIKARVDKKVNKTKKLFDNYRLSLEAFFKDKKSKLARFFLVFFQIFHP